VTPDEDLPLFLTGFLLDVAVVRLWRGSRGVCGEGSVRQGSFDEGGTLVHLLSEQLQFHRIQIVAEARP